MLQATYFALDGVGERKCFPQSIQMSAGQFFKKKLFPVIFFTFWKLFQTSICVHLICTCCPPNPPLGAIFHLPRPGFLCSHWFQWEKLKQIMQQYCWISSEGGPMEYTCDWHVNIIFTHSKPNGYSCYLIIYTSQNKKQQNIPAKLTKMMSIFTS